MNIKGESSPAMAYIHSLMLAKLLRVRRFRLQRASDTFLRREMVQASKHTRLDRNVVQASDKK
jgi:hypothetical protein